jgi:hypothetical protein
MHPPCSAGEPAPEKITDKIYGETQKVSVLKMGDIPDIDLSKVSVYVCVFQGRGLGGVGRQEARVGGAYPGGGGSDILPPSASELNVALTVGVLKMADIPDIALSKVEEVGGRGVWIVWGGAKGPEFAYNVGV